MDGGCTMLQARTHFNVDHHETGGHSLSAEICKEGNREHFIEEYRHVIA
jgi:hypothetical protein